MKFNYFLSIFLFAFFTTNAQEQNNRINAIDWIMIFDTSKQTPAVNLEDMYWLQGTWITTSKDFIAEHIILEPKDAQMPGFVRSVRNGKISFYEITAFVEVGNSIHYRVKHFTSQLEGWEAQNEFIDRPLVKLENEHLFFDGITFRKKGERHFTVYFLISEGERKGEVMEIDFSKKS